MHTYRHEISGIFSTECSRIFSCQLILVTHTGGFHQIEQRCCTYMTSFPVLTEDTTAYVIMH